MLPFDLSRFVGKRKPLEFEVLWQAPRRPGVELHSLDSSQLDFLPGGFSDSNRSSLVLVIAHEVDVVPGISFNFSPREDFVIARRHALESKAARSVRGCAQVKVKSAAIVR